MACYVMLSKVISFYVILSQVKTSSERLCHVSPGWKRFGKVKTGYDWLDQFRSF
jgi:hypothetical protein